MYIHYIDSDEQKLYLRMLWDSFNWISREKNVEINTSHFEKVKEK